MGGLHRETYGENNNEQITPCLAGLDRPAGANNRIKRIIKKHKSAFKDGVQYIKKSQIVQRNWTQDIKKNL